MKMRKEKKRALDVLNVWSTSFNAQLLKCCIWLERTGGGGEMKLDKVALKAWMELSKKKEKGK